MSKAIIGMTDEFTKKITMECIVKAMPEAQLIDGSNDLELFFHLQREDDQVILIFDRFFLSYILVFILLYLKIMNSRNRQSAEWCFLWKSIGMSLLNSADVHLKTLTVGLQNMQLFQAQQKKPIKKQRTSVWEGM